MIEIVRANTSHTDIITEIGKLTFIDAHGHSAPKTDIEAYVNNTYTTEIVKHDLLQPEHIYHILYYNNQVAGYSKIVLNTPNENVTFSNITKLERIYFLKEFYGLSLGKTLFDFNVDWSKKHQQKGIWLNVWVNNFRAIQFYKKTGFEIVGEYHFKISKTHSNPNHVMYLDY